MLVPHGRIAAGKLAQALVHDARLLQVEGGFDDCLRLARELADSYPVSLVNSVNAYRIEGQKTAAFEVVDAPRPRPRRPLPARRQRRQRHGVLEGLRRVRRRRRSRDRSPRMWGFQAAGAAPIVARRAGRATPTRSRLRSASATRRPGHGAIAARDESGGLIDAVTDEPILDAQRLLSAREGVFVEPASRRVGRRAAAVPRAGRARPRPARRLHRDRQRAQGHRDGAVAELTVRTDDRAGRRVGGGARAGLGLVTGDEPRPGAVTVRSRRPAPTSGRASTPSASHSSSTTRCGSRATPPAATRRRAVTGEGAGDVPARRDPPGGPRHARERSTRSAVEAPALALAARNRIPHGRGLGSSAAAVVAGVLAARALVAGAADARRRRAARLAAAIEGHPDNAAAALLGGLTIAWTGDDGRRPRGAPRAVAPSCAPPSCVPGRRAVDRDRARAAAGAPSRTPTRRTPPVGLPCSWRRSRRRPDLLLAATEDRLHQDYRAPAMPATAALVARLRAAGLRRGGVRCRAHRAGPVGARPAARRRVAARAGRSRAGAVLDLASRAGRRDVVDTDRADSRAGRERTSGTDGVTLHIAPEATRLARVAGCSATTPRI